MSPQPTTESEIRRELLRLSMRNSARSVPAPLIVAGFVAVLGQQAGRLFAAMAVVALGLAVAGLRLAMARRLRWPSETGAPGASEFAAKARRLAALEPLLEERVAKANGNGVADDGLAPLLDAVRALRVLAERWQPLVLVVDDDRFQHKVLGQLLAAAEAELVFVTSATEAIAGLHKRRPDLILMDVSLPDVNGVEATRLLKSAAQFAAIPVIMITGVGGKTMVVDSLKAGATDFVVKPFDKVVLLGKVLYGRALP